MGEIRAYLEKQPLAENVTVETVTIYETAKEPTLCSFSDLATQFLSSTPSSNECHLFIHFGVHSNATAILLEQNAWNEMNFRVPDQRGFQPIQQPICATDGSTTHSRMCELPLADISTRLSAQHQFNGQNLVGLSTDPGRFLCNYLYYISLCETSKYPNCHSLFVHVPPFEVVPKSNQLVVIHALLTELCRSAST